jgi:hypothetical protein
MLAIAFGFVSACGPSSGPPARLIGGTADTVIINHTREVQIPVRVLDSAGHALVDSGVRFRWIGGEKLTVAGDGSVTCAHSLDALVEASLDRVSTTMLVRCRPVKKVYIAGPIQFLLPDTAQEMRIKVLDLDGNEVSLLKGTSDILDTTVATIDGMRVIPKSPGATVAGLRFGNQSAGVGVHVYEKVNTLDALRNGKQYVGIVLQMSGGEMQSWRLPGGTWMLTMLPEDDEQTGLRLRIENANCTSLQLTRRRYACLVKTEGKVIVHHPSTSYSAPPLLGKLLVRHINS